MPAFGKPTRPTSATVPEHERASGVLRRRLASSRGARRRSARATRPPRRRRRAACGPAAAACRRCRRRGCRRRSARTGRRRRRWRRRAAGPARRGRRARGRPRCAQRCRAARGRGARARRAAAPRPPSSRAPPRAAPCASRGRCAARASRCRARRRAPSASAGGAGRRAPCRRRARRCHRCRRPAAARSRRRRCARAAGRRRSVSARGRRRRRRSAPRPALAACTPAPPFHLRGLHARLLRDFGRRLRHRQFLAVRDRAARRRSRGRRARPRGSLPARSSSTTEEGREMTARAYTASEVFTPHNAYAQPPAVAWWSASRSISCCSVSLGLIPTTCRRRSRRPSRHTWRPPPSSRLSEPQRPCSPARGDLRLHSSAPPAAQTMTRAVLADAGLVRASRHPDPGATLRLSPYKNLSDEVLAVARPRRRRHPQGAAAQRRRAGCRRRRGPPRPALRGADAARSAPPICGRHDGAAAKSPVAATARAPVEQ